MLYSNDHGARKVLCFSSNCFDYQPIFLHGLVGNMFLAIDEPSKSARNSHSDLSSIMYKEEMVVNNQPGSNAKQPTGAATAGEDEIRMEVKKEVERINKHSKPAKPVEGKGPTVASAKKADIIRQEIMNLKEIESQKANNLEEQAANDLEIENEVKDEREVQGEHEVEHENEAAEDKEATAAKEDEVSHDDDVFHDEKKGAAGEDQFEEGDDVGVNEKEVEIGKEAVIDKDTSSIEDEIDSGISVEDYLKQMQGQEEELSVEEYIARMTESGNISENIDVNDGAEKVDVTYVEVEKEPTSLDKFEAQEFKVHEIRDEEVRDEEVNDRDFAESNDADESERSEGESENEEEEEQVEAPRGMIPAKQQRMLIDAVLSLDYPSDSDSDTDDIDEICHYAHIERPSTPKGDLSDDENEIEYDKDDPFNMIISAPPGFGSLGEEGQQTQAKVRDHNVQYGATQEGKPVVYHTFMKSGQSTETSDGGGVLEERKQSRDESETMGADKEQKDTEDREDTEVEEQACVESIIEEKRSAEVRFDLAIDQTRQARLLSLSFHPGITS